MRIVGAASGNSPNVEVFNGTTVVRSYLAFAPGFVGGVNVAAGDVNGDGIADIIVGAVTGSNNVRVFDGVTNNMIANFQVPGTANAGVRVSVADIDQTTSDQVLAVVDGSSLIYRYRLVPNFAAETPFQAFSTPLSGVFVGSM